MDERANGDSGVMLQLKLMKTAGEEVDNSMTEDAHGMLHGTRVVKELIGPCFYSGRIVCGDSYLHHLVVLRRWQGLVCDSLEWWNLH